jgi:hypothetical protein
MALLILVFAILGIKRENQVLMYLFVTGIFFLLFYNGFLLTRIFDPTLSKVSVLIKVVTLFWGECFTTRRNGYLYVYLRKASLGLFCALLTIIATFACLQYFGRGFLNAGELIIKRFIKYICTNEHVVANSNYFKGV